MEFSLNSFSIQIEVFIQLEPAKRSYSTFLERYTKILLSSNQKILQKFELSHKGFLSGLFSNKLKTGSKQFDSKYQIKVIPENIVYHLFDNNALNFFVEKNIIEANLHDEPEKGGNVIELKFPEILFTLEDIESIRKICQRITEVLYK